MSCLDSSPAALADPFLSLLNPQAGTSAHTRLASLNRTVHKPLDKPLLGRAQELEEFDEAVDSGKLPAGSDLPARAVARKRQEGGMGWLPGSARI